jgi:uncharacterized protein
MTVEESLVLPIIRQFVFHPTRPVRLTPAALGLAYEDLWITTSDGVRLRGFLMPSPQGRHTLLHFHGNAQNIGDWMFVAPPLVERGFHVVVVDYRGYGDSEGKPEEKGLYLDGEAVWSHVCSLPQVAEGPLSLWGKSLGSAVAIHLAAQTPPTALILESAFTSMRELVLLHAPYVPQAVVPPLFESLPQMEQITCPTLLIHGHDDELVPLEHAERLHKAAHNTEAQLEIIPSAGHNDVELVGGTSYHETIVQFLDHAAAKGA